jgi:hypothetical protein
MVVAAMVMVVAAMVMVVAAEMLSVCRGRGDPQSGAKGDGSGKQSAFHDCLLDAVQN